MTTLHWSGAEHWSRFEGRCYFCGGPTNLRDEAGVPAHKVCVEAATDHQHNGDETSRFDFGRTA